MGRPLPSRFFGNRNTGSASTTADDGLSGEGVESISTGTVGSFSVNNTYKNFPNLVIPAPDLPTGVQAVADVVFELDTVTFASGGQTNADYVAGLSTGITGMGGGAVIRIVETASKVTSVDLVGGNRGEFRRGDFDGTGITTHQVLQAPNAGTDLQITATYRVKSITMTEKGSGYTSTPSLSWNGHTFTTQTAPSAQTVTMTTPDGTPNSGYDFATIKVTAQTTSGGSALTGDIVAQKGSRRYRVATTDGTAVCSLVAGSPAVNQMSLIATDYSGNTYYVTKLTRHRVLLTQNTGSSYEFVTGSSAAWTLDSLVAGDTGITVQLANN